MRRRVTVLQCPAPSFFKKNSDLTPTRFLSKILTGLSFSAEIMLTV